MPGLQCLYAKTRKRARAELRSSNILSFPPCLNRRLIADLIEAFLAIEPCSERAMIFRSTALARLEQRRQSLGLSSKVVRAEMLGIEHAVACRLAAMFPKDGGAA